MAADFLQWVVVGDLFFAYSTRFSVGGFDDWARTDWFAVESYRIPPARLTLLRM